MNQKSYPETPSQNINLISSGTKINGDINADGDIRIDGFLKGNIKSKGRLSLAVQEVLRVKYFVPTLRFQGNSKGKFRLRNC